MSCDKRLTFFLRWWVGRKVQSKLARYSQVYNWVTWCPPTWIPQTYHFHLHQWWAQGSAGGSSLLLCGHIALVSHSLRGFFSRLWSSIFVLPKLLWSGVIQYYDTMTCIHVHVKLFCCCQVITYWGTLKSWPLCYIVDHTHKQVTCQCVGVSLSRKVVGVLFDNVAINYSTDTLDMLPKLCKVYTMLGIKAMRVQHGGTTTRRLFQYVYTPIDEIVQRLGGGLMSII